MVGVAVLAMGDVGAERGRAARADVAQGTAVAGEHGTAVPGDVVGRVAARHVGEGRHDRRGRGVV